MDIKISDFKDKPFTQLSIIFVISIISFIILWISDVTIIPNEFGISDQTLVYINLSLLCLFLGSITIIILRSKDVRFLLNRVEESQTESRRNRSDLFLFMDTLPCFAYSVDINFRII